MQFDTPCCGREAAPHSKKKRGIVEAPPHQKNSAREPQKRVICARRDGRPTAQRMRRSDCGWPESCLLRRQQRTSANETPGKWTENLLSTGSGASPIAGGLRSFSRTRLRGAGGCSSIGESPFGGGALFSTEMETLEHIRKESPIGRRQPQRCSRCGRRFTTSAYVAQQMATGRRGTRRVGAVGETWRGQGNDRQRVTCPPAPTAAACENSEAGERDWSGGTPLTPQPHAGNGVKLSTLQTKKGIRMRTGASQGEHW